MADRRSRIEKLREMANQTASPNEARIARRMLEQMGEDPDSKQSSDPFENIKYSDKRGQYESEETFRRRQAGASPDFNAAYWERWGRASQARSNPFEEKTRSGANKPTEAEVRKMQSMGYRDLLELYRKFKTHANHAEYTLFEKLLQEMDPNGVYFYDKMARMRSEGYFRGEGEYSGFEDYQKEFYEEVKRRTEDREESERRARENYYRNSEEIKKWDEERRQAEASMKAAQKIKDERERRERDESMGSSFDAFDKWFADFKKRKK